MSSATTPCDPGPDRFHEELAEARALLNLERARSRYEGRDARTWAEYAKTAEKEVAELRARLAEIRALLAR